MVRTRTTVIGTLMVKRGEADAMICGSVGRYPDHLRHVRDVIGYKPGVRSLAALNLLILPRGSFFLCDTHVNTDPTAEVIAEMTQMAATEVARFGITPKVALLSHSSFGSREVSSAAKMRDALSLILKASPDLEVEGEMQGDAAVSEIIRERIFPNSRLKGSANLLIMPTIDAANIAFNLLKILGEGLSVGPILLGTAQPVHILTQAATVRGIVNMTAFAVADAQSRAAGSFV